MHTPLEDYFSINTLTLTFFNKLNVVNYKKCGTRYMNVLSETTKNTEHKSHFDVMCTVRPTFNYQHTLELDDINFKLLIDNLDSFNYQLNKKNINSVSDLFFNNSQTKLLYIIRQPNKRIISGITQNLIDFFSRNLIDDTDINYLKNNGFSTNDIDIFLKYFDGFRQEDFEIDQNLLKRFVNFFLKKYFYYIIDDIHTENYLLFFSRLISNSNTENLDIIDIDSCDKYALFNYIKSNTDEVSDNTVLFDRLDRSVSSNKYIYDSVSDVIYSHNFVKQYIRDEVYMYHLLKKSKYYKDIK